MTDQPLFSLGDDPDADTFPWPIGTDDQPGMSSSQGLHLAQTWPDLTPAERGAALFVGDGLAGPGNLGNLARALGVTTAEAADLLWGLLRKGYLQAVAGWWTR